MVDSFNRPVSKNGVAIIWISTKSKLFRRRIIARTNRFQAFVPDFTKNWPITNFKPHFRKKYLYQFYRNKLKCQANMVMPKQKNKSENLPMSFGTNLRHWFGRSLVGSLDKEGQHTLAGFVGPNFKIFYPTISGRNVNSEDLKKAIILVDFSSGFQDEFSWCSRFV